MKSQTRWFGVRPHVIGQTHPFHAALPNPGYDEAAEKPGGLVSESPFWNTDKDQSTALEQSLEAAPGTRFTDDYPGGSA